MNYINDFDYNPYNKASSLLPKLKKEFEFLSLSSSTSLQMTTKDLADAFVDFKKHNKGFVKTKKKYVNKFSFNSAIKIDYENSRIFIPKIGYVRFKQSRPILGKPFNVTVNKEADKWFVIIQTKRILSPVNPSDLELPEKVIGIDMGIKKFIAMSEDIDFEFRGKIYNTTKIQNIDIYGYSFKQLSLLQQKLSKKKVDSKNYLKLKKKIAKLYKHIADTRQDFLHKLSTAIVNKFPNIAVENLKIKNMSKSNKGTKFKPGKNVKSKKGLNRSILRQGWGMFIKFLAYKLHYMYNFKLMKVNPKNSSNKCSKCGHTHKENRKSQAKFVCMNCGFTCNADKNASYNISAAGQAAHDCKDDLLSACVSARKRKSNKSSTCSNPPSIILLL